MGFLEDLRRKVREEDARRAEIAAEQRRISDRVNQQEEARRLGDSQVELRVRQQREQAEEFLRQSEFPRMAQELVDLGRGIKLVDRPMSLIRQDVHSDDVSSDVDWRYRFGGTSHRGEELMANVAGFSLIWTPGRRRERSVRDHRWEQPYTEWEDIYNVIVVKSDYQGAIKIVKSSGDISLSLSGWRNNPGLQEESLGRAYQNPRVFYQKNNNKPRDITRQELEGN